MIYFCVATAPTDGAAELARRLIEERLAACVNIVPKVRSIYRWEETIHDEEESLLNSADSGGHQGPCRQERRGRRPRDGGS